MRQWAKKTANIFVVLQEGCEQQRQGRLLHGGVPLRGDDRAAGARPHAPRRRAGPPLLLHAAVGEARQPPGLTLNSDHRISVVDRKFYCLSNANPLPYKVWNSSFR